MKRLVMALFVVKPVALLHGQFVSVRGDADRRVHVLHRAFDGARDPVLVRDPVPEQLVRDYVFRGEAVRPDEALRPE
eukprot:5502923-Pyramimonas_sp.AAC.1